MTADAFGSKVVLHVHPRDLWQHVLLRVERAPLRRMAQIYVDGLELKSTQLRVLSRWKKSLKRRVEFAV
jgi:hypothetical protein